MRCKALAVCDADTPCGHNAYRPYCTHTPWSEACVCPAFSPRFFTPSPAIRIQDRPSGHLCAPYKVLHYTPNIHVGPITMCHCPAEGWPYPFYSRFPEVVSSAHLRATGTTEYNPPTLFTIALRVRERGLSWHPPSSSLPAAAPAAESGGGSLTVHRGGPAGASSTLNQLIYHVIFLQHVS